MRGIAALMVAMFHTSAFFGIKFQESYLAVDLFFIISGSVIADAYQTRLLSTLSFKQFMLLRFIRLWPLYILGIAVTTAATLLGMVEVNNKESFAVLLLPAIFMLPDFTDTTGQLYPLNFPCWSLFFELIVNTIYAKLVAFLNSPRLMIVICLSALCLAACLINNDPHTLDAGASFNAITTSISRAFYSFFAGVFLYRLFSAKKKSFQMNGKDSALNLLFILCIILLILAVMPNAKIRPYFDFISVTIVFPLLVYAALHIQPTGVIAHICAFMGTVSYALYVLHVPIGIFISCSFYDQCNLSAPAHMQHIGYIFLPLLILLCWLIDFSYDLPVRRFLLKKSGMQK